MASKGNRKQRREAERVQPVAQDLTREEAKVMELAICEEQCQCCKALRTQRGLANSVSEKVVDGARYFACHVCNSTWTKPKRRYDNSMRQEMNVAGPCPLCSKQEPQAPQDTAVYSKAGNTRYCRCNRCRRRGVKTTWPWTPKT